MSASTAQVSATVSAATRETLDRIVLDCIGVVTDAKPDVEAFYRKLGFLALEGVREGRLHGDPTPMFLDLRSIAAALEAPP